MSYFDNDYLDVPSYEFLQRYPKVYAGTNIHLDGEVAKIISEDGKRYEIVLWVIQSFTEYFANKYPLDEADYTVNRFSESGVSICARKTKHLKFLHPYMLPAIKFQAARSTTQFSTVPTLAANRAPSPILTFS